MSIRERMRALPDMEVVSPSDLPPQFFQQRPAGGQPPVLTPEQNMEFMSYVDAEILRQREMFRELAGLGVAGMIEEMTHPLPIHMAETLQERGLLQRVLVNPSGMDEADQWRAHILPPFGGGPQISGSLRIRVANFSKGLVNVAYSGEKDDRSLRVSGIIVAFDGKVDSVSPGHDALEDAFAMAYKYPQIPQRR